MKRYLFGFDNYAIESFHIELLVYVHPAENEHGTQYLDPWRGDSFWKPSCAGSILAFWECIPASCLRHVFFSW